MAYQTRMPGSQASLREANRGRIVDALHRHGGLTKVELAGATGLSAGTVHNIVKELSLSGALQTVDATRSGRRAVYVTLAHEEGIVVGIHVSLRHLRIALADVTNNVVAEHEMPLAKDHRADNELRKCLLLIADMLESVGSESSELLGVAIALPAPLDQRTGTITRGGLLRGWERVPVADVLHQGLGKPIQIGNAGNLSTLAEFRLGALRGKENAMFIEVGDDIGGGLIIRGSLYAGRGGVAGEMGHMVIKENGPLCRCGNRGCLEAVAGGQAVLDNLKDTYSSLKLNDLIVRAMAGDDACIRAIAEAGNHIGVAVANVANLIDPERVVIGGELSRAGELLLAPMRHVVERSSMVDEDSVPDIVTGQLGTRAAMLGAVVLANEQTSLVRNVTEP